MNEQIEPAIPSHVLALRSRFDEDGYLLLYPDVAAALAEGRIGSAWQHYAMYGYAEGRRWVSKPDALIEAWREIAPADDMFNGDRLHYFDAGESALHCIASALVATRRMRLNLRRILDLPCGHGRVMRFLKSAYPEAELTACDLNRDGVEYCAKVFGAVPVVSDVDVTKIPLQGDFDLIWCGSLLTHLPLRQCEAFLQLFERLLGPGGIIVFTLHGRSFAEGLPAGTNKYGLEDEPRLAALAEYRRNGFGYADYRAQPGYGISLTHPSFTAAHFVTKGNWRMIGYHESGWDKRQDVISLQKDFSK